MSLYGITLSLPDFGTLESNKDIRWKLVQWHVAAWPSVRDFEGNIPRKIRDHWVPVIEKHNVDLVIEAHDHAYKKTVPIRNNSQDDENGIVYMLRTNQLPGMHVPVGYL